jgi:hypothetical protein
VYYIVPSFCSWSEEIILKKSQNLEPTGIGSWSWISELKNSGLSIVEKAWD